MEPRDLDIDKRYDYICDTVHNIIDNAFQRRALFSRNLNKYLIIQNYPYISDKIPSFIYLKSGYVSLPEEESDDEFDYEHNKAFVVNLFQQSMDIVKIKNDEEMMTICKAFWNNKLLQLTLNFDEIIEFYHDINQQLKRIDIMIKIDNNNNSDLCSVDCFKSNIENFDKFIYTVSDEYRIRDAMIATCSYNYCKITKLVDSLTCSQVFRIIQQKNIEIYGTNIKPYVDKRTMLQKLLFYTKRNGDNKVLTSNLEIYQPCNHTGSCNTICPCYNGKNFCEKYCGCDQSCLNKFDGCACTAKCQTNACPCFVGNRECDPIACKKHSSKKCSCKNMVLQSGTAKKLEVKMSSIDGIGLGTFAAESINSGEFIIEYTGELITHEEGERRAEYYSKIKSIYLFSLCKGYDIDAFKFGNESRFINHSSKPNCQVRCLIVHGVKRIAFFAIKDIKKGDELFFKYAFNKEHEKLYFK